MGSLPDDARCAYCDEPGAGYIPDGCAGALCGPCVELVCRGKFNEVKQKRKRRYLTSLAPVCKKDNNANGAKVLHEVGAEIAEFLIHL